MDTGNALTTRQRLLILTLTLGLTGPLVGVVACGPAASTGTLQIVVTGLPTATVADVAIGTQQVTGSTSLTLAPGGYTLLANPVVATASIMGDLLAPDRAQVDVTVRAGRTTTVTIAYSVAQRALLLAPQYGGDQTISVLTIDDLVDGGTASSAWKTDADRNGYDGMAFGPDGRLYVADGYNDTIVVVDGADLTSDGLITPAAVISIDGPDDPSGVAFDSSGNLWVGTYSEGVLMRFDGVLGLTGTPELAPALILTVDDSTFAKGFRTIHDVFVDHLDNVWVADWHDAIYRFHGIGALTGPQTRVPDLFLEPAESDDSLYATHRRTSLVVDGEGTLYTGGVEVWRFDDALALSGHQTLHASAYLYTSIEDEHFMYPHMVALDQSGALWVAHLNGKLVRITDPGSYEGFTDVTDEFDLELSWLTETGDAWPGSGTIIFVPTQGRYAGY